MKVKLCLLFISTILISSCESGTHFKIENKSDSNIELIIFSNGLNKISVNNLKKKGQYTGFLDFYKNGPKYDGNYNITVHYSDTVINKGFGYYSNGIPSDIFYKVIVKNDTIIVNEYFMK